MNKLKQEFSKIKEFSLVNKEWRFLDYVYTSSKSIYALKEFNTNNDLKEHWEKSQMEFATQVQAKLDNEYDGFRWDMYLIFLIKEEVSSTDRKYIENNRMYFKKILISDKEEIKDRLPFTLIYNNTSNNTLIYDNNHFLLKLKEELTTYDLEEIGADFFSRDKEYTEKEIYEFIFRK